ncbi:MAG TPA: AAA family ATPase [Nocardioidaceae bacterium]|nr:AAA family ATPase [Nocardioidaceae bacterium]
MTAPRKKPILPLLRRPTTLLVVLASTLFAAGILLNTWSGSDPVEYDRTISVTELIQGLDEGRVDHVTYYDDVDEAVVEYRSAGDALVSVPEDFVEPVMAAVVDAGIDLEAADGTPGSSAADAGGPGAVRSVFAFGLMLAGLGVVVWLLLRLTHPSTATGGDAVVRRRRKHSGFVASEQVTSRFSDVAGADEAVDSLAEMVGYLRDPSRFTRLGAKPPRGALLVGPPGTGKTLLARAVAGEAGVAFLQVSGSDFVEKFVGVGAKRVRELFAAAREHERAIVFIDELDAIARRRGSGDEATSANAEGENTLIALLTELDGFADRGNIIVIGATNRPDVLDPAVTRPGRLDRKVEVPNPDRRGREQILSVHAGEKPLATDVDLVTLARRTPGFSGAQLAAVVNEAAMVAARQGLDEVTHDCFDAAVATVAMGRARTSALVTEHDRRITAWHEAGHAVAAFLVPEADDPVSVTIVPRGPAGGVTWMGGSDDVFLPRRKAHAQLVVAMAGRAAEEVLLDGEYTQGASGDLAKATETATAMVTRYGMSELGYAVRDGRSTQVIQVVDELLRDAHARATDLLARHERFLAQLAEELLEHETLSLTDIARLAERCGVDRQGPVALRPVPSRPRPSAGDERAAVAGRVVTLPAPPVRRRTGVLQLAASLLRRRRPGGTPPAATA